MQTLDSSSSTNMDSTHVLEVSSGPASALGYLLYSPFSASLPIFGGTLLVDLGTTIYIPVAVDGSGELSLPLAIPADPLALGLPLNFQVALRSGPGPEDFVFSNGLSGVVCDG